MSVRFGRRVDPHRLDPQDLDLLEDRLREHAAAAVVGCVPQGRQVLEPGDRLLGADRVIARADLGLLRVQARYRSLRWVSRRSTATATSWSVNPEAASSNARMTVEARSSSSTIVCGERGLAGFSPTRW
jgi:hypothetical protein